MRCPNCRNENPEGSRFCNHCGHRLEPQSRPAQETRPAPRGQPFPDDYKARLELARREGAMVGERRIVTMLFCDVSGSTAAAEQLDPEDWAEIINGVFARMTQPVVQYEGTVARLMGDAILAFFGAPIAHEDDPQRAILAGLDIVAAIQPFRLQVLSDWGVDLNVRVGINTGLVMVGQVGSDLSMEYTALGDAINLAARMEQSAEPGTVQVAEETYRLTAPLFAWQALGKTAVKGKRALVQAYRPLRPVSQTRNLRGLHGLDAPLTGREAEWNRLWSAAREVRQGSGRIFFLVGEAGLGKSRLFRELKTAWHAAGGSGWQESASPSYEAGQPYALFRRLLRRAWELEGDAGERVVRRRLEGLLDDPDRRATALSLLGFGGKEAGGGLEGENLKRALFNLVRDQVSAAAERGPAVFVFDDLHWSDPASMELLGFLFRLVEQRSLLFACALRPDSETPGWKLLETAREQFQGRVLEARLMPLSEAETGRLVHNLLPIGDLPAGLQDQILEKTDGNPFFVEEVLRTLIENGDLVCEEPDGSWKAEGDIERIEIPGTLQSLLTARIDRLSQNARQVLQLASVIGRTFYTRVLASIRSGAGLALENELVSLIQADMILPALEAPEAAYMFRHALTQETAYSTLLHRQRRVFHLQVGEAIEALFAARLEHYAAVLARHFSEAGDLRALRYAVLAGDAAFRLFAVPEAITHYRQALRDPRAETALSRDELLRAHLHLGRCSELDSDYGAALDIYSMLERLGARREDGSMRLAGLLARATALAIPGSSHDPDQAQSVAEAALLLADQLGDRETRARLMWVFQVIQMYSGRMPAGVPFGEQAVALARELGLLDLQANAMQDLAIALMPDGQLDRAEKLLREAEVLWDQLQNLPMLAETWANRVYIQVMQGDFKNAFVSSQQAHQISTEIENAWGMINARVMIQMATLAQGEVDATLANTKQLMADAAQVGHPSEILAFFYLWMLYRRLGAFELAGEAAQKGFDLSVNFQPFHPLSQAMRVRQYVDAGEFEQARSVLAVAEKSPGRKTLQMIDLVLDLVAVHFYSAQENWDTARSRLDGLMGKLRAARAGYFVPDVWLLQARLDRAAGDPQAESRSLEQARQAAEEIGARIVLWRILALLGREEQALQAAGSVLGSISDPQLRRAFIRYAGSFGLDLE